MAEVKMPHTGHEKHLCLLQNVGYFEVKSRRLQKNGKRWKICLQGLWPGCSERE